MKGKVTSCTNPAQTAESPLTCAVSRETGKLEYTGPGACPPEADFSCLSGGQCTDYSLASYDEGTSAFKSPAYERTWGGFVTFCAAQPGNAGSKRNAFFGGGCKPSPAYSCREGNLGKCVDYTVQQWKDKSTDWKAPAYGVNFAGFQAFCAKRPANGGILITNAFRGGGCRA